MRKAILMDTITDQFVYLVGPKKIVEFMPHTTLHAYDPLPYSQFCELMEHETHWVLLTTAPVKSVEGNAKVINKVAPNTGVVLGEGPAVIVAETDEGLKTVYKIDGENCRVEDIEPEDKAEGTITPSYRHRHREKRHSQSTRKYWYRPRRG